MGGGEVEEHPRSRLATGAPVVVAVGTDAPVEERPAEKLVDPGEAREDLALADLAAADPRLVAHDEAGVVVRPHAGHRPGHVGHEGGTAVLVHNRTVVAREDEGPSPVEEERATGRRHARDRTTAEAKSRTCRVIVIAR